MGNVVQKLHRTYAELEGNTDKVNVLSVYNKSIRGYISHFLWDEGHFNPRAQLRDLVQVIHSNMVKTAEHLRKWTSSLSQIQNQLSAIERKKSGSLMNRSLTEYINHEDWYNGEYIASALVVVPTAKCQEFLAKYEFFEDTPAHKAYYDLLNKQSEHQHEEEKENGNNHKHDMNILAAAKCRVVVPDSAKHLAKDEEFSLYRVLLLRRGYAWFKFVAMKNGFAVRDFDISELETCDDDKSLKELEKKESSQKKKLKLFCKNTFSETFANWMHLKVIRAFVESVLRFGLPVDFSISVIKPVKGKEEQLLKTLEQRYAYLVDKVLQKNSKDDEHEIDYSGLQNDFYPFVYVQTKIEL